MLSFSLIFFVFVHFDHAFFSLPLQVKCDVRITGIVSVTKIAIETDVYGINLMNYDCNPAFFTPETQHFTLEFASCNFIAAK